MSSALVRPPWSCPGFTARFVQSPPSGGWSVTWRLLAEESSSFALTAGFDPPLLFNPSVCVHVRRQEPPQELFARLTQ